MPPENLIFSHFLDANGKQLVFAVKKGTDSTALWKGTVRVACVKVLAPSCTQLVRVVHMITCLIDTFNDMIGRGFYKGSRLLPAAHSQAVLVGLQVASNPNSCYQRFPLLARQLCACQPCQGGWRCCLMLS